ncbi:hypothetical protein TRIUR3_04982 [Triticum urartu]|uniref:Uncharacterized protein n=1 Tax=Triticum urartu TaxID=4572 RepID=M8AJY4_TRIUA|nr:hypothetical protein TRIUR3_04982 [Triticum urartu]
MENPVVEPISRLTRDLIAEILSRVPYKSLCICKLTHDLIAEILCRVPYKSLCICKCVCPAWRGIIADPANRKKMAQTLAGFF